LVADKKKTGGNGAVGVSHLLARCVQEVEGLVPRKAKADAQIDRMIVRGLYQPDRDFLLSRILMLSGHETVSYRGQCDKCRTVCEETVTLASIPVVEWPADQACEIEFELPVGYTVIEKGVPVTHKKGVMRFPRGVEQELAFPISQDNAAQGLTAILAACITKLGTLESVDQEICARLKSRDRSHIFRAVRDQMPGLRMWKHVYCDKCGNPEVEVTLSFGAFFK
jgi:hypothetical protein